MTKVLTLKPLYDYVLVRREIQASVSPGGIVLPVSLQNKKSSTGTVEEVGEGKEIDPQTGDAIPLLVKPGDRVIFTQYSGTDVKYEGIDYVLMREADIMAVENEVDEDTD